MLYCKGSKETGYISAKAIGAFLQNFVRGFRSSSHYSPEIFWSDEEDLVSPPE